MFECNVLLVTDVATHIRDFFAAAKDLEKEFLSISGNVPQSFKPNGKRGWVNANATFNHGVTFTIDNMK